jgi:hypothetical protein
MKEIMDCRYCYAYARNTQRNFAGPTLKRNKACSSTLMSTFGACRSTCVCVCCGVLRSLCTPSLSAVATVDPGCSICVGCALSSALTFALFTACKCEFA